MNGLASLVDGLTSAAFAGDVAGVLSAAARHMARDQSGGEVVVGLVDDQRLAVSVWPVTGGALGAAERRSVPLSADEALADAARSGRAVASGASSNGSIVPVDVALPFATPDSVIGVLGARSGDGRRVDEDRLSHVASLVSLALEHARVRRSSRTALQQTVTVLAALIESRDSYTESHCVHLAESGLAIGVRMGLPARRLDRVTFGGLLHDIGKVAVSDAVLNKPGPLDSDEYLEMQTHASIGEGILARIGFLENVAPIVRQHHERLDGQGYPGGLKGEEILLEARILAVVDTFDAMTTTRPYRAALPWSRAVEEIRAGAGTQFDPEVVGVFLQYLEGEVSQWTKSSPT